MVHVSFSRELVLQVAFLAYKFNRTLEAHMWDDLAREIDEKVRTLLTASLNSPHLFDCSNDQLGEIALGIYKLHRRDRTIKDDIPVGLDPATLKLDKAARQFLQRYLSVK